MADNITLNAGSGGSDLDTTDVGGDVHVQHVAALERMGELLQVGVAAPLTVKRATGGRLDAGTINLVALVATKQIRVLSLVINSESTATFAIQDTTPTNLFGTGVAILVPGGHFTLPYNPHGWFDTTVSQGLDIVSTVEGFITAVIYCEV